MKGSWIASLALAVIAVNLTIMNMSRTATEPPPTKSKAKVVEVIGRVTPLFTGLDSTGFLVRDGNELRVVRYDKGSMASQEAYKPSYLQVVEFTDGRLEMAPAPIYVQSLGQRPCEPISSKTSQ